MSKFWMMGGAVIAVSVAAMVWNPGPVRSSEDLLGKAQSEFAMKARDALVQRRMAAQASAAPASTEPSVTESAPQSASTKPYVVASLEPVAPPMATLVPTRSEATIAEAAPAPVEAPVASRDSSVPPVTPAAPAVDAAPPMEAKTVSLPAAPQASTPPQPVPAATQVSEPAKDDTPAATPAPAKSRQKVKTAHRTNQKEPMAGSTVRRSERTASRNAMPYNLETLRARAPEIAAAIARYM